MAVGLDDYRWLVGSAADAWLQVAADELVNHGGNGSPSQPQRGAKAVRLLQKLRRELSPERAHLVIEQTELRQRAREKFAAAERMFFTRQGLEQATDEWLATYKAARFAAEAQVTDLCCGIGGDFLALAQRGPATGVDRDPVMSVLAGENARQMAGANGRVIVQDICTMALDDCAWHCDPDRRSSGRRTTRGELMQPPLDTLDRLVQSSHAAAIKLAPATVAPPHWADRAELEWLGSRGECRQQVAWFGTLARHRGQRSASIVDGGAVRTVVGRAEETLPSAAKLGQYLYEPHAAVLAARLAGVLCREHHLAAISPGVAYLTSDARLSDGALAAFQIEDVLPLDRKKLQAYCRQRGLSRLEIKKRGVEIDPERLRKEIVGTGNREATILLAPVGGQVRAIVAHRVGATVVV